MRLDNLVQKLGYKDYKTYLNSTHWKAAKTKLLKSKLVRRDSNNMPVCEACASDKKLQVHHRTYKTIGKERVMDLALVCELCHSYIHKYSKDKGMNLWSATKRAINEIKKKTLKKEASKEIDFNKLDKEVKSVLINFGKSIGLIKNG